MAEGTLKHNGREVRRQRWASKLPVENDILNSLGEGTEENVLVTETCVSDSLAP